ncbi:MAG: hypothetical protein NTZ09_08675 [Candidatus Hydrogenedentes bacterium]|nr:hypothetical protein [Candidatus Hydrogenedentota bacterium]
MKTKPPWTREELRQAYFRERNELDLALQKLPGFSFFQKLEELEASYSIFVSATGDLLESIHRFRFLEQQGTLYDRHSRAIVQDSVTSVRRGIFSACSAAKAFVEHTGQIAGSLSNYHEEKSRFVQSELHEFIHGLRNYSVHCAIAVADWRVHRDFEKQEKQVSFLISKKQLLRYKSWHPLAKQLIDKADESLDIEAVFVEYAKKVADFHRWLRHRIIVSGGDEYQQYLSYKNAIAGFSTYSSISLILSGLTPEAKANSEMYLDRFLTNEEISVVLSLPAKSRERVDKIISILDLHEVCDERLRAKLYELFNVKDV